MSLQPHVANPLVLTKSISLCVKAAIKKRHVGRRMVMAPLG